MSLLNKIRSTSASVAKALERADFRTDSDIKSLTRTDLLELLPGHENLKMRKTIFELIQTHRPVDAVLTEMKAFIPDKQIRAALTGSGPLVEYFQILKDMKSQMNNVQDFLDAHIGLLEEFSRDQPVQGSNKGSSTVTSHPVTNPCGQTGHPPLRAQGTDCFSSTGMSATSGPVKSSTGSTITYRILVNGKTFNAEQQLMNRVIAQNQSGVQFVESSEGHQITILFCPISSRIGSDVDAAMSLITDDKPILLVLMHHVYEPKVTGSPSMWSAYKNIVLHVNVFYHETKSGLLTCNQNSDAIKIIEKKLLEYNSPKRRTWWNFSG